MSPSYNRGGLCVFSKHNFGKIKPRSNKEFSESQSIFFLAQLGSHGSAIRNFSKIMFGKMLTNNMRIYEK